MCQFHVFFFHSHFCSRVDSPLPSQQIVIITVLISWDIFSSDLHQIFIRFCFIFKNFTFWSGQTKSITFMFLWDLAPKELTHLAVICLFYMVVCILSTPHNSHFHSEVACPNLLNNGNSLYKNIVSGTLFRLPKAGTYWELFWLTMFFSQRNSQRGRDTRYSV